MDKKAQLAGLEIKYFLVGFLIGFIVGAVLIYLGSKGTINIPGISPVVVKKLILPIL